MGSTSVKRKRNSEVTSEQIFAAATAEFSEKGFGGARVDNIAERARINKSMIYHYFNNKEQLYIAVLEGAYSHIRSHEQELALDHLEPVDAIRKLVNYTFSYFIKNPQFIRLLNNENLHNADHIRASTTIRKMHTPLIDRIDDVLERGKAEGVFRSGVDAVQLYITVAALGYFYLSNASTLEVIFGRKLRSRNALNERRKHIEDVVLGFLQSDEINE